jgi:kynurenine formamidase
MSVRLIDLSMEVYQGMMTYPNVTKPVIVEMESHWEMARSVGADQFGVEEITNHCMIVTGDHVGTHIDSRGHIKPDAPRAEGIPIELCYGDGVVLDLTHKGPGEEIPPADIEEAERKLGGYRIKPLDIVLLRTDAAKLRFDKRYLTDHPGMTKEAVHLLLDRGVKVMGIDPPVAKQAVGGGVGAAQDKREPGGADVCPDFAGGGHAFRRDLLQQLGGADSAGTDRGARRREECRAVFGLARVGFHHRADDLPRRRDHRDAIAIRSAKRSGLRHGPERFGRADRNLLYFKHFHRNRTSGCVLRVATESGFKIPLAGLCSVHQNITKRS